MKKPIYNKAGMRIINFESEHKTFNKYIVSIGHGNVWGGGQYSNYIRPYSKLECNGRTNAPGHLRQFDLQHYKLSWNVRSWLDKNKEVYIILYEFYHYSKGKKRIHGHVIEEVKTGKFHAFKTPYASYKSDSVLYEAIKFLNKAA